MQIFDRPGSIHGHCLLQVIKTYIFDYENKMLGYPKSTVVSNFTICSFLYVYVKDWNTQLKSYHHNQSNTWAKSFVVSERREQRRWNYSTLREAKMQNLSSHQNQHNFISAQCSKSKQEATGMKSKIKIILNCYLCKRMLKYNSTHNFWLSKAVRTSESPHIKDHGINKRASFWRRRK